MNESEDTVIQCIETAGLIGKLTKVNDTHKGKLCFTQFSTKTAAWLLLTLFICLHNQLSFLNSIITYYRVQMFEKCDSSYRQQKKMNGCSFQNVLWQNMGWFLS